MPNSAARMYDGEKLFTEYEKKGVNESRAIQEWKSTFDRCEGDGFAAARAFQKEQPALFATLEASGKSFEELCDIASKMSGNDVESGWF